MRNTWMNTWTWTVGFVMSPPAFAAKRHWLLHLAGRWNILTMVLRWNIFKIAGGSVRASRRHVKYWSPCCTLTSLSKTSSRSFLEAHNRVHFRYRHTRLFWNLFHGHRHLCGRWTSLCKVTRFSPLEVIGKNDWDRPYRHSLQHFPSWLLRWEMRFFLTGVRLRRGLSMIEDNINQDSTNILKLWDSFQWSYIFC